MRKTAWKITVFIIMLMMIGPSAFSASLNSWVNISNNTSKTEVDGEKTTSLSSFSRNFNLSLNRPVTPLISYDFHLRANLLDSEGDNHLTNDTTISYRRSLEPTLELFIRNNIYDLNAGYRRNMQWSTAHYSNSSKVTSEFYYSRFSVVPENLPTISLDLDRLKNFDHLPEQELFNTTDSYSVSSSYILPSKDLRFGYNIVFSEVTNKTPLSTQVKSNTTTFSNNYNIGYAGFLWGRKIHYTTMYQGNYSRNRDRRSFANTGTVVSIRGNNGGLSALNPDKQVSLDRTAGLADGNLITSTGIDLSLNTNNHIGIQILFGKSVDRLFIYVDENIGAENVLDKAGNWQIFMSSDNSNGSWTEVDISNVDVEFDALNDKYFYEILFSSSQEEFYFKAVNLNVSSISGVNVTEIQALGTDEITDIEDDTAVTKSFSQGINLNVGIRPAKKWDFSLSYSIDRADQNPASVTDSISGIIENIFSKSLDNENENVISTLSRNYGASSRWQALRQLTPSMNIRRSENFNNTGGAESATNNYSLGIYYVPLPTVDTNLSVVRSDSFTDSEKTTTSDSLLLSADTKLHRDLNMVTDIGYSRSNDLAEDTTTSLSSINGSLDARITRKMSGTLNYGYSTATSGVDSTHSKIFLTSLNYQAGRFINFQGNFDYTNSAGNEDISESLGIDWLPLPKLRMNFNYRHSSSDGGVFKKMTDSVSGYGQIYITRFADLRVSYTYSQTDNGETSELATQSIRTNLNCRF